jgi:hypothetical protein
VIVYRIAFTVKTLIPKGISLRVDMYVKTNNLCAQIKNMLPLSFFQNNHNNCEKLPKEVAKLFIQIAQRMAQQFDFQLISKNISQLLLAYNSI